MLMETGVKLPVTQENYWTEKSKIRKRAQRENRVLEYLFFLYI
jgi:hypothetical protein